MTRSAVFLLILFTLVLSFPGMPVATIESSTLSPEASASGRGTDDSFNPGIGKYSYTVSWAGIPAGRATVTITREGDNYQIRADARAIGAIDTFYRLRYRGEGLIDATDLNPIRTALTSREGNRRKENVIQYLENGRIETTKTRSKNGKPPSVQTREFNLTTSVYDPFSAIFLARKVKWQEGLSREFQIFTGSDHYRVRLTATEKRALTVTGKTQDVWVIVPTVDNLTSPEKNSKLTSATLYLSADTENTLLMLESKVFIGSVRVCLDAVTPL